MSVVAGCLLLDGVLLTADTRITYLQGDGSKVYVDNALKILPLAPGTAIGYVGNVRLAAALLKVLIKEVRLRSRTDPVTLSQWMPRFLKREYKRLIAANQVSGDPVTFMIASSVEGRPTRVGEIERSARVLPGHNAGSPSVATQGFRPISLSEVKKLLSEAVSKGMNGIVAGPWFETIMLSNSPVVSIADSCAPFLYTISSPVFVPEPCLPLHFTAIGSGQDAAKAIERIHGRVLFNHDDGFVQEFSFLHSVRKFAEHNNIASVGGLYPLLRIKGNKFRFSGESQGVMGPGGSDVIGEVSIRFESGRWIQRNTVTGRTIPLELPWNIADNATQSKLFDDIDRRKRR